MSTDLKKWPAFSDRNFGRIRSRPIRIGFLMRFIAPNKLMGAYSVVNIMLVSIGVLLPGWIGLWSVFLYQLLCR